MRLKIVFALALASVLCVSAQQTNPPGPTDYAGFSSFISRRNIFDPNRYPRSNRNGRRTAPRSPSTPTFALVGTMEYQKGVFAFFDGNNSDYRKILEPNGSIAGYTVTEITPAKVTLQAADKEPVEMKIGAQMRQDGQNGWELSGQHSGSFAASALTESDAADSDNPASPETGSASSFGGEQNDVLKRLMQQREQELK